MKSWVAWNGRYLWEVRDTEKAALACAARHKDASVKGFEYGKGDKVITRDGEVVTIDHPARSVTGGIGYAVYGAKHGDFVLKEDIKGLVPTIPWKDHFSHLVQVAVAIGEEKRDLTEAEYKAYEGEGGGDIVDDFCNNLTDKDVENFVNWARAVAARGKGE